MGHPNVQWRNQGWEREQLLPGATGDGVQNNFTENIFD